MRHTHLHRLLESGYNLDGVVPYKAICRPCKKISLRAFLEGALIAGTFGDSLNAYLLRVFDDIRRRPLAAKQKVGGCFRPPPPFWCLYIVQNSKEIGVEVPGCPVMFFRYSEQSFGDAPEQFFLLISGCSYIWQ